MIIKSNMLIHKSVWTVLNPYFHPEYTQFHPPPKLHPGSHHQFSSIVVTQGWTSSSLNSASATHHTGKYSIRAFFVSEPSGGLYIYLITILHFISTTHPLFYFEYDISFIPTPQEVLLVTFTVSVQLVLQELLWAANTVSITLLQLTQLAQQTHQRKNHRLIECSHTPVHCPGHHCSSSNYQFTLQYTAYLDTFSHYLNALWLTLTIDTMSVHLKR